MPILAGDELSRMPSRSNIPVSNLIEDENCDMVAVPLQSQGVHHTTAVDDDVFDEAGQPTVGIFTPDVRMPEPRMKRMKDGMIIAEDTQEGGSEISGASWSEFQLIIKGIKAAPERRMKAHERSVGVKMQEVETRMPRTADVQVFHDLTVRVAKIEIRQEETKDIGRNKDENDSDLKSEQGKRDNSAELKREIHEFRKVVMNHCHYKHVGELIEQMEDRESEIINIARDFRDFINQVDVRATAIEVDLTSNDPWARQPHEPDKAATPQEEDRDGASERMRKVGGARGPDDYFSKRKMVNLSFRAGVEGPSKLPEWQGKQATYASSKKSEAAKWQSWAAIRKEQIDFGTGGGRKLVQFDEVVAFDRQLYDAPRGLQFGKHDCRS